MPEQKRPWRNMAFDLATQFLKSSENSPILAGMLSHMPSYLGMVSECLLHPELHIKWELGGLKSDNSHLFNVNVWHFAQMNEIADSYAKTLHGYAELVKASAKVLPDTTKITMGLPGILTELAKLKGK